MNTPRLDPAPLLTAGIQAGIRRWTLQEYHALAEMGLLTEDQNGIRYEKVSGNFTP